MFMFQVSNFRSRAIGLRIKETKEVYEGEVTELTPVETESPTAAAGSGSASGGGPVYGKTISHLIIGKERRKALNGGEKDQGDFQFHMIGAGLSCQNFAQ